MLTTPRAAVLVAAILANAPLGLDAHAQLTRIEVEVVESPAFGGESFGEVGQYERLRGLAYGEIDPGDPRHSEIVNLERAPLNDVGWVEYSTTIEIYRPIDIRRWNRSIYNNVPDRGRAGIDRWVRILDRGFALAIVGWQGDLKPTATNIVPFLPVARNADGTSVVGPVLEEIIFDDGGSTAEVRLTYEAATLDPGRATLTVRRDRESPSSRPTDLSWSYRSGGEIFIRRPSGFDGSAIYEFLYEAKDPIVMGLGFVAMRDVISFLRYDLRDSFGNRNPLAFEGLPSTAISLGISQSGRFLRDMLYQGFNEDVAGRIVFDGIHPDIAGGHRTFTNYQFGQPGRLTQQHEDHLYPGDQFPFSYTTLTDPISGRTDGLLERCSASNTCPKIVHTDSETELWRSRASLVVTDPLGRDIELPENVRAYLVAGTRHGGGPGIHATTPTRSPICQNLTNPLAYYPIRTALTLALYEWVAEGVEPPPSRFPTVSRGGLVPAVESGFPRIPGVTYTGSYNGLRLHDHRTLPPTSGDSYSVLVGRVDKDGNAIGGIRLPTLSVPIGTHTGWNLRREGFAGGALCAGPGSFIPFKADRSERRTTGDPRLSLQERYPTHDAYVSAVAEAADELARGRLLLRRDADEIVRSAASSAIGR